jgi:hypothetical protein
LFLQKFIYFIAVGLRASSVASLAFIPFRHNEMTGAAQRHKDRQLNLLFQAPQLPLLRLALGSSISALAPRSPTNTL